MKYIAGLMGVHPDADKYQPPAKEPEAFNGEIPESFDARAQWPNCSVIGRIRDQSACGSCLAFGSTEAFEDRHCIATGKDVVFSVEDTGGCAAEFGDGCSGGDPIDALQWMVSNGVVTGGDYADIGKGTGCSPYKFAPCAHHVHATAKYPKCPEKEYYLPCNHKCA